MVFNSTFNNISVISYWWRKPEYLQKTIESKFVFEIIEDCYAYLIFNFSLSTLLYVFQCFQLNVLLYVAQHLLSVIPKLFFYIFFTETITSNGTKLCRKFYLDVICDFFFLFGNSKCLLGPIILFKWLQWLIEKSFFTETKSMMEFLLA